MENDSNTAKLGHMETTLGDTIQVFKAEAIGVHMFDVYLDDGTNEYDSSFVSSMTKRELLQLAAMLIQAAEKSEDE